MYLGKVQDPSQDLTNLSRLKHVRNHEVTVPSVKPSIASSPINKL